MKKILVVALALALLLTLAACKDGDNTECAKHKFSSANNRVEREATCTEEGMRVKVCKNCGYEEKTAIPKKDHAYKIIGETATCTESGEAHYECTICGHEHTEEIPSKGHQWKNATCQKPKTCSACGISEGAVSEHRWSEATCLSAKTCRICGITEGGKGEHEFSGETCSLCGKENTKTLTYNGFNFKVPDVLELQYDGMTFKINIESIGSDFEITYSIECVSGSSRKTAYFDYSLYDPEGYVVTTGYFYTLDMEAGEKARNQKFQITSKWDTSIERGKTYTLKITR